ncbi:MAG: hypothetical protein LJE62_09630 [Silicimonas sp.]|jgi:hypothetical protein|nr:hypothetical protein [Silicimonas sp.]
MLKIASGAVFALTMTTAAVAQDTVTWQDDIQGWSVAIDRTIDNSCFIISGFEDDLFLRFQFNATQQNVQLIVASVHWDSVETGGDYDVEVAFGGLDAWTGVAKGHRWNEILPSLVLSVPIEDQQASHFMTEFTATETVSISHDGSEIATLALSGADEAIASMLDCQAAMSKVNDAKRSGDDPFAPKPDPI